MDVDTQVLNVAGLQRFHELRTHAASAVTERFGSSLAGTYAGFGPRGREACRQDLSFHLEFLRPVLEFGLLQPMVDYLRWLESVLVTRGVPAAHLALSLDWMAEFFAENMEPPHGAIVADALHRVKAQYVDVDDARTPIHGLVRQPWPEGEVFEGALLAGDRRGAAALLARCLEQGRGLVDAELHMIQPALYGIGLKWQENQVSVAQEHLATAIAQAVMTEGLMKSTVPAPTGRTILLACVEGNDHCVGLQMVADAFQLAGWDVQFLGANVPTGALLQHVRQLQPNLLGLSVSFAQQLHAVKDIMSHLVKADRPRRPSVILGGLAINRFNRLAVELGADGWSPDAGLAVASGERLAPLPGAA